MSWLRDQFHTFIFPAFLASEKKSSEIGPPVDVKASPSAPDKLPTELRKLWTLCQDFKVEWSYDVRELNSWGGSSKYRESARIHHSILRATLDSAMCSMRAEGCNKLFLGGRDVWTFAVMCERRKIPYMFIPELSRHVTSKAEVRPFLESRGFTGHELFLDTGFAGSIPRNLAKWFEGIQFKFRLMSQHDKAPFHLKAASEPVGFLVDGDVSKGEPTKGIPVSDEVFGQKLTNQMKRPNQLFPNRKKARDEALETEYLAKFWKTGTFDNENKVVQYFSDKKSIQRAALLTSMLWRGIPYWKHMGEAQKPQTNFLNQAVVYSNNIIGQGGSGGANGSSMNTTGSILTMQGTVAGGTVYSFPSFTSSYTSSNVVGAAIPVPQLSQAVLTQDEAPELIGEVPEIFEKIAETDDPGQVDFEVPSNHEESAEGP